MRRNFAAVGLLILGVVTAATVAPVETIIRSPFDSRMSVRDQREHLKALRDRKFEDGKLRKT